MKHRLHNIVNSKNIDLQHINNKILRFETMFIMENSHEKIRYEVADQKKEHEETNKLIIMRGER